MSNRKRKKLERNVQILLRDHPYLLDPELLNHRGRTEISISGGRIDIDFQTSQGLIVVECKISRITDQDIKQLCSYLNTLKKRGESIYKAYLVGRKPAKKLNEFLLKEGPGIQLKYLFIDVATHLALCEEGHYFDKELDRCPFDNTKGVDGQDFLLEC